MRFIVMFVTAVCVLFLIKLRWPKKKSIHVICSVIPDPTGYSQKNWVGERPARFPIYPIYDHNLRYSLHYLWPYQKFETLFMTRPLINTLAENCVIILAPLLAP